VNTLIEFLKQFAESQPQKLLAADINGYMTYEQAWKRAINVASRLRNIYGINRGDRILVQCKQNIDYLSVYLGCVLQGAVFVPVEDGVTGERIRKIADETECSLYVDIIGMKPATTAKELIQPSEKPYDILLPSPNDISEILYTTGTTGVSKGIVLTNRANVALAENVKYGVQMKTHNVELIPLVMSHSHGLRTFYANLLNGSSVVIANGAMNVKEIFKMIDDYGVTSVDFSPSVTQILIKLSKGLFWEKAKKLDYIEIGTAPLNETLKEQLVQKLAGGGVRLYNFYGSTESGRVCVLDFSKAVEKKQCIGKPSKNALIIFTDDDRKPIKTTSDKPGLLASCGPMNMTCYWKNEKLTNEVLISDFVCTNDMGYYDPEGYIYIIGRKDDVINFNGIKIAPSEIEEIVIRYSGIAEAACVGEEDSLSGQIPKLFIVPDNKISFDVLDFKSFLADHLDHHKMTKMIEIINALPRTYNGKIDRKKLRRLRGGQLL
jgi:acyl-coenzyme A synthetase/AMP-(fatty) acid ligase